MEEEAVSISGSVLADLDNNDTGDVGILGVVLTLVDGSGNPVDGNPDVAGVQTVTTTTANNGSYSFNDLPRGTYGVLEEQPSGFLDVNDVDGGDPSAVSYTHLTLPTICSV